MVILSSVDEETDANSLHCSWTAGAELMLNNVRDG